MMSNEKEDLESNFQHKLNTMTKEDLIKHILENDEKKKYYIKNYHQSEKGRISTRNASKKYYEKNKELILMKKKEKYQSKKNI